MDYFDPQVGRKLRRVSGAAVVGLAGLSAAAIAAMEPDHARSMLSGLGETPNLVMTGPGFKRDPGDRDGPIFTPELAPQYGQVWSKPLSPEGQANVALFVSQNPQWADVLKKAQGMDKLAKVSAINAEVIYRKAVAYAKANGMPIPRKPDKNTLMKAGIGIALIGLLAAAPLIVPAIVAAAPTIAAPSALTSGSLLSTVGTAAAKAVVPLALKAVVPGASAAPATAAVVAAPMALAPAAPVAMATAAPSVPSNGPQVWHDVFVWERVYQNAVASRAGQSLPHPNPEANIPAFNPSQAHDWSKYLSKIEMYRSKIAAMQATPVVQSAPVAPSVLYAPQPAAYVPAAPAYTPTPTTYEDFSSFAVPAAPAASEGYDWQGYRDSGFGPDFAPEPFTPQPLPSQDYGYAGDSWTPDYSADGGGGWVDYGYGGMGGRGMRGLGFDFGDLFSNIVQNVVPAATQVVSSLVSKVASPVVQPVVAALPALGPVLAPLTQASLPSDAAQVWHDTFVLERTYLNEVNRRAGKPLLYADPEANIPALNPSQSHDWDHYRSKIATYRSKLDEMSRMPIAQKVAIGGGAGLLLAAGLALLLISRSKKK